MSWLTFAPGLMTVVQAGRDFKILAQNKLDGQIMACPIAFDGTVLIRTDKALYRIGRGS